jgi:antitoxin component of MazEF toxin-antitoxin module
MKGTAMKIKHLTRQGNSLAVIIDRPILDMLDITEQTPLKLNVEGRKIVLEPVSEAEVERHFTTAADKVEKKFGRMFKRLAEK